MTNLALSNTSSAVAIRNTGGVTITSIDGLTTSSNTGTTTTFSAGSPFTYAVNFTSAGTITTTTTNTPATTDGVITVDSGVEVQSTGGSVIFDAGADIVLQNNSTVEGDGGVLTLTVDFGGTDPTATLQIGSNVTLSFATALNISEPGTISLDALAPFLDQPGKTITVTSTAGAIVDSIPPDGDDDTDVIAGNLALSAATGIGALGTPAQLIVTQVSNLVANTATGGIFITNTGELTIGYSGDPFTGVRVLGGSGAIELTNNNTVNITTSGESITTNNGAITVTTTAGDIVTGGSQVAIDVGGSGATDTLNAAGNLTLGTGGAFGDITGGSVVLMADSNITIDEGTIVQTTGAASTVTATAGGNIAFKQTTVVGAIIVTGGGAVTLTTGAGGSFTAGSGQAGGDVHSNGGTITIVADLVTLTDAPIAECGKRHRGHHHGDTRPRH